MAQACVPESVTGKLLLGLLLDHGFLKGAVGEDWVNCVGGRGGYPGNLVFYNIRKKGEMNAE